MKLSSLIQPVMFFCGFGYENASNWIFGLKVNCSLGCQLQNAIRIAQLGFCGLRYGPNTAPCSESKTTPLQLTSRSNFSSLTSELASGLIIRCVGLSLNFPINERS